MTRMTKSMLRASKNEPDQMAINARSPPVMGYPIRAKRASRFVLCSQILAIEQRPVKTTSVNATPMG